MKWMLCFFFLPLLAAAAEPKDVVQDIFSRAGAPEVATDASKQGEVNSLVDYDALAKAALGKEGSKVSAQEFSWFRDTLKEIIGRTVFPKAPDFLKDVKISYDSVDLQGEKATVKSTVQNKADLTDVSYRLALIKDKGWRVVDVAISGQSWVDSIHDQVSEVIKKHKWAGLKTKMNKRLADLRADKG
jgi:ABC-type transporter MlaC component